MKKTVEEIEQMYSILEETKTNYKNKKIAGDFN